MARISVAESSVYRGIFNELRQPSYQLHSVVSGPEENGRVVDMKKWTFLEKLLAIEEAHDRRRMERERLHKKRECTMEKSDRDDKTEETVLPDLLSRWLRHQVLDDNAEEMPNVDPRSQSYLPDINTSTMYSSHSYKHAGVPSNSKISKKTENRISLSPQMTMNDEKQNSEDGWSSALSRLSPGTPIQEEDEEEEVVIKPKRKRQLRLPPILLPRVYTVVPRPLQFREFLTPTKIRGPITDEEWEDLKDCRYIRHALPRFTLHMTSSSLSSVQ